MGAANIRKFEQFAKVLSVVCKFHILFRLGHELGAGSGYLVEVGGHLAGIAFTGGDHGLDVVGAGAVACNCGGSLVKIAGEDIGDSLVVAVGAGEGCGGGVIVAFKNLDHSEVGLGLSGAGLPEKICGGVIVALPELAYALCVDDIGVGILDSGKIAGRIGGLVGYASRSETADCHTYNVIVGNDVSAGSIGGLVGYSYNSSVYGCSAVSLELAGSVAGDGGKGALAGYNGGMQGSGIISSYYLFKEGAVAAGVVGTGSAPVTHCIDGSTGNYQDLVSGVPDFADVFGNVWKASVIWADFL